MKCKCDFRTFMVGDGCDVCNPAKALEYARETIDEQAALIEEMGEALEGLERFVREAGEEDGSVFGWAAINADEGKAARAALTKWKESK